MPTVLLWNRMHFAALASGSTEVDTGLYQTNRGVTPPMGIVAATPPDDGTLPASRIMVIPLSPISPWIELTHGEPYLNTTTGTIHVVLVNASKTPVDINVLFMDPHSIVGPGLADPYGG